MTDAQKHILIVEDEKPMAHALSMKLDGEGFATVTASNGEEALEALQENTVNLILLDVVMPGLNGFDFLKELKENPEQKNIPVIIISNLSQTEDEQKAKELGAVKYFVKSDTPIATIVDEVKAHLSA